MATPTPSKHGSSQQGRTPSQQLTAATPPVSTPFSNPAQQAAFSPSGLRSSPQQFKKSPAPSSLMGPSGMVAFNFDSPSTAVAMGALGMGGSFDLGLDNVGGVPGLDAIGAALAEDDKMKRLDAIVEMLSTKKGLVSEAGLERLARRIGLELLSEEQRTPSGRKTRTLAIAGSAIALDIVLDNNIVQSVSLAYHGSAPSVSQHMEAAGKILLGDLTLSPGQSPLTKTLDGFAANFERLAALDKLSIVPGLDCHEALAGIYTSLNRLYQWDLARIREEDAMKGRSDRYLRNMVMCARHGRPAMHERGRLGLAWQYWRQHRYFVPTTEEMAAYSDKKDKFWSLFLGCAPLDGIGVPPVRVSEDWISKDIVREDATTLSPCKTVIDWQEPENISLSHSDDTKDAGMDLLQPDLSTTRVPRVMFTVTFDPPVVLPQNDWARVYMCANVNPPNNMQHDMLQRGQAFVPPTFDSAYFPFPPGVKIDPSEARSIVRQRELNVYDDSRTEKRRAVRHSNTLFIYKPIYAQVVSEMPFSHPRQLLEMLPLLRQYAFLSALLENSFGPETTPPEPPTMATPSASDEVSPDNTRTKRDELSEFMNVDEGPGRSAQPAIPPDEPSTSASTRMDVILWVHPSPQMQVVFPMGRTTANVTFKILEGGVVEILEENILGSEGEGEGTGANANAKRRREFTREKLAGVLEHMEDLCKWAEWIRTRL